ncbi:MAG: SPFH domain-containing protein [Spirochaetes bacterium]|nr:SPFH domain-containing protein [Spirochaetota bacterium]
MGLINFIKGQFIEVIEWTDPTTDIMVWRFPDSDKEIKMGAQLTVRESQVAIFVNEGNIADVYAPGRYELVTQNMPILTKLMSWKTGFNSPFKAEVYFINTKQFTDQKWGTSNPIMMRDKDFGMIRLRGFGNYSYKVSDPVKFLREVFGTNQYFTTSEVAGQLKRMIISGLTDLIAESKIPALDLASNYDELSEMALKKMKDRFADFGFEIVTFYIENLSLPPEVEKMMDKRTSMGVVGNVDQYAKFQMADSIDDFAKKEGGSNMADMGVGMAVGNAMGNMFTQQQQSGPTPPPVPPQLQFHVVVNGQQAGPYDLNTLKQMAGNGQLTKETLVRREGMANWDQAQNVNEVKGLFGSAPPPIPPQ